MTEHAPSEIDNGGPAFPFWDLETESQQTGLSLRDYFAAHAPTDEIEWIIGHTTHQAGKFLGLKEGEYNANTDYFNAIAKARGMWADAMLAEREKGASR